MRSEDTALVTRRVMFATEQCLLVLTHHPAVWHQAAQYLDQSAKLLTEKGVRSFHYYLTIKCVVQMDGGSSMLMLLIRILFGNKLHPLDDESVCTQLSTFFMCSAR